jgi:hypothetical protein
VRAGRFAAIGNLVAAAVLMLCVWLLLVWVASRPALKALVDLTPQRVNSVDPATVELLSELRERNTEVVFHLFLPPLHGNPQDAAQQQAMAIRTRLGYLTKLLLRRYQWLGGENVTIYEHNLYGDAGRTREAAQQFDYKAAEGEVLVVAVQPEGKELRFRKLSLISDLATIELPGAQVGNPMPRARVPVLKDYLGELQISSTLKSLLVQGSPAAYFLGGYSPDLDLEGASGRSYNAFRQGLRMAGFEVRDFDLASTGGVVPRDAALVIVLEPRQEFPDRDAEALFEYVRRGGRLFLNYSWAALPDWNPTGGKLGELLGYELSIAPVFHLIPDTASGGRTRGGISGPGVEKLQVQGSPLHPVTRRFVEAGRPLEVAAARALREREGTAPGLRREELLWTGPSGWLGVTDVEGYPGLQPPQGIGLQAFSVGMSIEIDVPDDLRSERERRTGQVVVISGVFCNNVGVRMFGDLAFNVCNWMADRRILLDIHGSRYEVRELKLQPQQLERIGLFLFYGVPGTFVVLGAVVVWLRRRA